MIFKGQCKVGSEKLNMRSKDPFQLNGSKIKKSLKNFKFKGNFHDLENQIEAIKKDRIETRETQPDESFHNIKPPTAGSKLKSDKRVFQNDRIYFDEHGKRIKDHIVYKDYVN